MTNHAKPGWAKKRLDELGFVGRGKSRHRPRNDHRLYGGPYPFVQTADIMAADPYISSYSQTYSEFGLRQSKIWPTRTLCMTIAGANTARTAILKIEACFPDSVVGFIPDPLKADLCFVKYSLDLMRNRFLAVSRGATQDNLSLDKLLSFPIQVPSIDEQHRTGTILSAYDDLIENNTRRIKILEEMAQALYREWFVHFRFPGHEKVKMVPSPFGPIPQGWSFKPIGDLLEYQIGGGWGEETSDSTHTIPANVIRGTDIPDARLGTVTKCPLRFHKESNVQSRWLRSGDIVFEASGGSKGQPVGRALLVHPTLLSVFDNGAICASFCKLLRPNAAVITSVHFYLYLLAAYTNGLIEKYQVQSTGITNFKFAVFLEDAKLVVPPKAIEENFGKLVQALVDAIFLLGRRNANLRRTRDLLLPRLISGEIDVSNLDIRT